MKKFELSLDTLRTELDEAQHAVLEKYRTFLDKVATRFGVTAEALWSCLNKGYLTVTNEYIATSQFINHDLFEVSVLGGDAQSVHEITQRTLSDYPNATVRIIANRAATYDLPKYFKQKPAELIGFDPRTTVVFEASAISEEPEEELEDLDFDSETELASPPLELDEPVRPAPALAKKAELQTALNKTIHAVAAPGVKQTITLERHQGG